ncbi:MAG: SH3 domain-containing protein [Candidatus Tectomicrobia bacterium]|uniref:SH3 domain-containing protein n=1 Tax=Tectimicrobiota bacterium TaxID=2528274 RepID=A0A932CPV1_UNCTE|nr:SH3 domain-containing protein [Candidatus Tectomicrobia bacterium]
MKYGVLWSVGQFYPLQVLSRNGRWYQVKDFEGDVGWIHRELTSKIPAVVVSARSANIRSGPGSRYQVRFVAERGSTFKILKKAGEWIRVRHADGDRGWVHRKLLWGLED